MLGRVCGLIVVVGAAAALLAGAVLWPQAASATGVDIVFVARAHLATQDDIFQSEVGPAGQFGTGLPKFAPGSKLMIRRANGTLVTLVDGANPAPATGNLIDVQSPDVSFDGSRIIFAGATTTDSGLLSYGWRLYEINANGSGFRPIAVADRSFTEVPRGGVYDFGSQGTYDWWNDLFPAYLADGRIVFSSTRYPSRAEYDERHTYNLYVMNGDGSNLHRISTERGGLLHPTPLPDGRILVARWWNNFNMPSDKGIYNRIDNAPYDQTLPDGTLIYSNTNSTFDPASARLSNGMDVTHQPNTWHLMALSPDGSQFERYAFTPYSKYEATNDDGRDTYTAAQPAVIISGTQTYVAYTSQADSTMVHSTQKTGIRVAQPGAAMMYANFGDAVAGLTYDKVWNHDDESAPYALHPWGMPGGAILFSYALTNDVSLPVAGVFADPGGGGLTQTLQGSQLQYQLYTMSLDGSSKTLLPAAIGTADAMDAKPLVARTGWQSLPDAFTSVAQDDPRYWNLPNSMPAYHFTMSSTAQIQTATLHNPNVYANAPLEMPFINNSPMPGSVAFAQVWVDANQFTGAYCYGYPDPCGSFKSDAEVRAILWTQVPVSARGEFTATIPADVPGFVILRDASGRAVSGWNRGYISIAQGNAWARPGQTVMCVGCHLGHVSGSLDAVHSDAVQGLTNIAPYAAVSASSTYSTSGNAFAASHLNDRRGWVPAAGGPAGAYADDSLGWISAKGISNAAGATITMTWPASFTVTRVRLVGPPPLGGDWGGFGAANVPSPFHVAAGTLRFYRGASPAGGALAVGQVEPLANGGTTVTLAGPLLIDRLTFTVNSVSGKWEYADVAALQEIEVIGTTGSPAVVSLLKSLFLPLLQR